MRGVLVWASATAFSFLAAAGMFLLLANMSARSYSGEQSLEPRRSSPAPAEDLGIAISKEELDSLKEREGQRLQVGIRNASGRTLKDVEVRVEVSSENTAIKERRSYREEIGALSPKETTRITVELDLSPFAPPDETLPERPRKIVEVTATAAGEPPQVKTAILPPG